MTSEQHKFGIGQKVYYYVRFTNPTDCNDYDIKDIREGIIEGIIKRPEREYALLPIATTYRYKIGSDLVSEDCIFTNAHCAILYLASSILDDIAAFAFEKSKVIGEARMKLGVECPRSDDDSRMTFTFDKHIRLKDISIWDNAGERTHGISFDDTGFCISLIKEKDDKS